MTSLADGLGAQIPLSQFQPTSAQQLMVSQSGPVSYPDSLTTGRDESTSLSQFSLGRSSVTSLSVSQLIGELIDSDHDSDGMRRLPDSDHECDGQQQPPGEDEASTDASDWLSSDEHTQSELHISLDIDELTRSKAEAAIKQVVRRRSIMLGPEEEDSEEDSSSEESGSSCGEEVVLDRHSTTTTTSSNITVLADDQHSDDQLSDDDSTELNLLLSPLLSSSVQMSSVSSQLLQAEPISASLSDALADIDNPADFAHSGASTTSLKGCEAPDEVTFGSNIKMDNDKFATLVERKKDAEMDEEEVESATNESIQPGHHVTNDRVVLLEVSLENDPLFVHQIQQPETSDEVPTHSEALTANGACSIPSQEHADDICPSLDSSGVKQAEFPPMAVHGERTSSAEESPSIHGSSIQLLEQSTPSSNASSPLSLSRQSSMESATDSELSSEQEAGSSSIILAHSDLQLEIQSKSDPGDETAPLHSNAPMPATPKNRSVTSVADIEALQLRMKHLEENHRKLQQENLRDRRRWELQNEDQQHLLTTLSEQVEADKKKYQKQQRKLQERLGTLEAAVVELGMKNKITQGELAHIDSGRRRIRRRSSTSQEQAEKLRRFFGAHPPLLENFLRDLGYEEYVPRFKNEKIGVLELPHLVEQDLINLGLPMGPRLRILHEAKKL